MTGATEEHSLPTAGGLTEKDKVTTAWFRLDGLFERMKLHMAQHRPPERRPSDYDPSAVYRRERRQSQYHNGDSGNEDKIIKRWHLALTVAVLMIMIVGSAWRLSEQMSTQFATQAVQITNMRDHQRDQDERNTRIEQHLEQLAERAR